MSNIQQLAVFAENRPGELARLTNVLAEAGINLRWITIATTGDCGVMRLVVDRGEEAAQRLSQSGFMVTRVDILAVEVEDRPGTMAKVAKSLAHHGINVRNASGFVIRKRAVILLEVEDPPRACTLLQREGVRVLTAEEMLAYE
jgi:hypothetical protein